MTGHEDRAGQNPKIDEEPELTEQILMNYQDFLLFIGDFDMLGCWSPAHTPVPHTGTDSGHFSIEVAELHETQKEECSLYARG